MCSNLHGGGTDGQELSRGGALREPLEASLAAPGQSIARTCGISHVRHFKPVQCSELGASFFSASMQNGVQHFISLEGVRGTYFLLDPRMEEMGHRVWYS